MRGYEVIGMIDAMRWALVRAVASEVTTTTTTPGGQAWCHNHAGRYSEVQTGRPYGWHRRHGARNARGQWARWAR